MKPDIIKDNSCDLELASAISFRRQKNISNNDFCGNPTEKSLICNYHSTLPYSKYFNCEHVFSTSPNDSCKIKYNMAVKTKQL